VKAAKARLLKPLSREERQGEVAIFGRWRDIGDKIIDGYQCLSCKRESERERERERE